MTAQVSIVINGAKNALCIPVSTLGSKEPDGRYMVKVLKEKTPEDRLLRVGISNNVHIQVLEGIEEGEAVIIGDSTSVPATTNQRSRPPHMRRR